MERETEIEPAQIDKASAARQVPPLNTRTLLAVIRYSKIMLHKKSFSMRRDVNAVLYQFLLKMEFCSS